MRASSRAGVRLPRAVVVRMRRWETLTALVAVMCAILGASRVPGHAMLTVAGMALITLVAVSRLREIVRGLNARAPSDAAERAKRIREERKRRLGRS